MYYMIGGAGYHNFGDELMVRCWLQYLVKCGVNDSEIFVDGANRHLLADALSAKFPNVNYVDVLNKISDRGEKLGFWDAVVRGYTFYKRGGFLRYPQHHSVSAELSKAKIVHIHGGGYLNKHFSKKGFLIGVAAATVNRTGARLIGTGLGLMPLALPEKAHMAVALEVLNAFQFIEARDNESAEFLQSLGLSTEVISGLDDTFCSEIGYNRDGKHRLHISWNESRISGQIFSGVMNYIDRSKDLYDEVLFWHCARNDEGAWHTIHDRFPAVGKIDFSNLISRDIPLNPGDHMLTARFHPHLIGARGGAIGGFLSPGGYYDVKHGSVVALGSGFSQLSGPEIQSEIFDSGRNVMFSRVDELLEAKAGVAGKVFELLCL